MNIHGKRVLVTGAAPEIDLALAQTLTRKGARPVLSGGRLGPLAAAVAELVACGSEACALSADIATGAGRTARYSLPHATNQAALTFS
jgi:NAD(P)-dependent dehydrogenase (short-subunit alcohol dehydrogenase family)